MNHQLDNDNDDDDVKVGIAHPSSNEFYDREEYLEYMAAARSLQQQVEMSRSMLPNDDERKPSATAAVRPSISESLSSPSNDEKAIYRQQLQTANNILAKSAKGAAQGSSCAAAPGAVSVPGVVSVAHNNDIEDGLSTSNRSEGGFSLTSKGAKAAKFSSSGTSGRLPGAEYVERPAQGISTDSILVRQAMTSNRMMIDAEVAPVALESSSPQQPTPKQSRWGKLTIGAAVCIFLVSAAIVLGVLLGTRSSHSGNSLAKAQGTTTASFDSFKTNCSTILTEKQPHVITQCHCNGNITKLAAVTTSRYYDLTKSFIPTVDPNFNETLESCSPENQALVWLASGDGMATSTEGDKLRQRYHLALLFLLWNGPYWDVSYGWLSSNDECNWYGVSCNQEGEVVDISLSQVNVQGDLVHVTMLTTLVSFTLSFNNFENSSIPTQIALLTNLQSLVLSSSNVNGTIPVELFSLNATLKDVIIDSNSFFGTIPTLIGQLTQLENWSVGWNSFTGTIPTEIGHCEHLQVFGTENNKLNGTIPSNGELIKGLKDWNVANNDLTGIVPKWLWSSSNLNILLLYRNHFNGTIPTDVGLLTALDYFDVHSNAFSGTIPSEFGRCIRLKFFSVDNNTLTGTVPSELENLHDINVFDIKLNHLNGSAPPYICQRIFSGDANTYALCIGCNCPQEAEP